MKMPDTPDPRAAEPVLYACPDDPITRKEVVAIIYNAMLWQALHPGEYLPPDPLVQQFPDMPDSNPFSTAFNSFKAGGIIGGKPSCG